MSGWADEVIHAFEDFSRAMNAPPLPTGDTMRSEQFYRTQADEMLARAALAAKIAATPDVYNEGTVVKFTRTAQLSSDTVKSLQYAAIKITLATAVPTTRWFITGTTPRSAMTWDKLLDFIGEAGLTTLEVMHRGFFPFMPDINVQTQA